MRDNERRWLARVQPVRMCTLWSETACQSRVDLTSRAAAGDQFTKPGSQPFEVTGGTGQSLDEKTGPSSLRAGVHNRDQPANRYCFERFFSPGSKIRLHSKFDRGAVAKRRIPAPTIGFGSPALQARVTTAGRTDAQFLASGAAQRTAPTGRRG